MVDITEHLALVDWVIRRQFEWALKGRIEYDDLVQAGRMGLMRAAAKFEPERGFAFTTYATNWVVAFIWRHIQNYGRLVRAPQWAQQKKLVAPERLQYLDASCHDDLGVEDVEHARRAARADVNELVGRLPPHLQRLIRLHLRGYERVTIANELGISRERVRQLEAVAIAQMRRWVENPRRRRFKRPTQTLKGRAQQLMQSGPYTLDDIKELIRDWDAARGEPKRVTNGRAQELLRLARKSLAKPPLVPLKVQCRSLMESNPNYTLADVVALIRAWDAEYGLPREVTKKRAWMLIAAARGSRLGELTSAVVSVTLVGHGEAQQAPNA